MNKETIAEQPKEIQEQPKIFNIQLTIEDVELIRDALNEFVGIIDNTQISQLYGRSLRNQMFKTLTEKTQHARTLITKYADVAWQHRWKQNNPPNQKRIRRNKMIHSINYLSLNDLKLLKISLENEMYRVRDVKNKVDTQNEKCKVDLLNEEDMDTISEHLKISIETMENLLLQVEIEITADNPKGIIYASPVPQASIGKPGFSTREDTHR